jgi:hypothetical protein
MALGGIPKYQKQRNGKDPKGGQIQHARDNLQTHFTVCGELILYALTMQHGSQGYLLDQLLKF